MTFSRGFPECFHRLSHAPSKEFIYVVLMSLTHRTGQADCFLDRFEGNPQLQGLVVVILEASTHTG